MLQDLVHTLVGLVDRRDPYSANHSRQVAMLSAGIARTMQLEPHLVETARIAGEVLNLGKMFVAEEILTRSGRLSPEEQAKVRESLLASADIVDGVEFDGPVCDTLRQVQEQVDGTGYPARLKGDAILPTARVVAVANAYVAMVSPRSYREGLSPDAAIRALLLKVDQAYDVKVVAALVTQLGVESRVGRPEPVSAAEPQAG
jgi:HD-GYP domain-containing protein (c-di-GMP phosphodiesterase class II)